MDQKMEALLRVAVEECKRRGMVANATCRFCGEVFLKQPLEYILAHTEACEKRRKEK